MPIVTNKTETIGSIRKADQMVERGGERTEVNRFKSNEPNRFTYVYKAKKNGSNHHNPSFSLSLQNF
jgi:hypothetical protein